MKVLVDGQEVRIENLGKPITIRTGEHKLLVTRDEHEFKTDTFLIRRRDEKVLDVTYTPVPAPIVQNIAAPAEPKVVLDAPPAPTAGLIAAANVASPAAHSSSPEFITSRIGQIKLRRIPAGTFLMGSPEVDKQAQDDEKPQHRVRITRSFFLGVYEVTQAQYEAVTGSNPSYFSENGGGKDRVAGQSTGLHPVESVTWVDAVKFCNRLTEREGQAAFYEIDGENVRVPDWSRPGYRLPTEAEWEYACRTNQLPRTHDSPGGTVGTSLGEFAWYSDNSGRKTHPVGMKRPNGLGIFDMFGNVWEWCWDGYSADYYKMSSDDDPHGLDGALLRVNRGGGVEPSAMRLQFPGSAARFKDAMGFRVSGMGFRIALVQSGE